MRVLAKIPYVVFCGVVLMVGTIQAQSISVNFSENKGNQHFTGGEMIGPLATDSAKWNNTNDYPGDLAAGTMPNLVDDSGVDTGASVTWESSNVWWNADGTGDDQHRMAVGYLDDGNAGVRITINSVPYAAYRVYGLLASDQAGAYDPGTGAGGLYDTRNFKVNGQWVFGGDETKSAPAYSTIDSSLALAGSYWSVADGEKRGNYWAVDATGPTLSIEGLTRSDVIRGSITGVVVQQIPEPSTLILTLIGLLGFVLHRRAR